MEYGFGRRKWFQIIEASLTSGASATYGTTYYSNAVDIGNLNNFVTRALVGGIGPLGAAISAYYDIHQGLCGK